MEFRTPWGDGKVRGEGVEMKKCIFQLPAPDAKLLFEKRRRGGG